MEKWQLSVWGALQCLSRRLRRETLLWIARFSLKAENVRKFSLLIMYEYHEKKRVSPYPWGVLRIMCVIRNASEKMIQWTNTAAFINDSKDPITTTRKERINILREAVSKKDPPFPSRYTIRLARNRPLVPFLQAAVAYKTLHRSMTTRDIPINCSYGWI